MGVSSPYEISFDKFNNAYIAIFGLNTISYCNVTYNGLLPVCTSAGGNCFSALIANFFNKGFVFVSNFSGNSISVCPIYNGTFGSCTTTGSRFNSLQQNAFNNNYAYITNFGSHSVTVCSINYNGTLTSCSLAGNGFTASILIEIYTP